MGLRENFNQEERGLCMWHHEFTMLGGHDVPGAVSMNLSSNVIV